MIRKKQKKSKMRGLNMEIDEILLKDLKWLCIGLVVLILEVGLVVQTADTEPIKELYVVGLWLTTFFFILGAIFAVLEHVLHVGDLLKGLGRF
jgi:hypothetical protein